MKKKKIFFTANVLWDIYIFRYGVIKALIDDGHEVAAVAPFDERIDFPKELGIKHIPIELSKRGMNPFEDLKLLFQLRKIYREEKPDLVFHYTIKPNIYGTLAARLSKVDSIAVLTGLGYSFIAGGVISKVAKGLYRFALKYAREVWVLNSDDKKALIEEKIAKENKIFILPGEGIDLNKFSPVETADKSQGCIFLMVARAFYDKGFREYIEAAREVKALYPEAEFWFLGALGGDSANGIDQVGMEKLEKEGIIKYLGHRKDVQNIICAAQCLVLPSYREGISKVLMEGAAMEKPLIASNVTGCREIVEDGKTGYLVKVKDSKDLAEKMIKFIQLPEVEKEKMGKAGRKKMGLEFDEKIIIEIYRSKIWS